jgi:uncharacterized surface protein with fasciclin (FAS1) repeats
MRSSTSVNQMVGLNKIFATIALAAIVLAFAAPAFAQGMSKAAPTMMPTAMPMAPTMMPTMMPGQGGMQGGMQGMPMQMTTSNKDMMATMQDMSDLSMAASAMKAMGLDKMMPATPHTMFVPNDMAVQKIDTDKMNMMMKDKQMAMNMVKGMTMDGRMMPSDMTDGKMLTMMNGQQMKVSMADGKMMIDGAAIVKAVQTSDGMLYVIDNMPSTMMSMMQTGAGQTGAAPAKM